MSDTPPRLPQDDPGSAEGQAPSSSVPEVDLSTTSTDERRGGRVRPPELPERLSQREVDAPRVPWNWPGVLGVLALTAVVGMLLGSLTIAVIGEKDMEKAVFLVLSEASMGVCAIAWVRVRHGLGSRSLGLTTRDLLGNMRAGFWAGLLGLAIATFAVAPLVMWIADLLTNGRAESPQQLDYSNPSGAVLAVTGVAVVLIAPIAEEIFFRGFVLQAFWWRLGRWPGALLSAALFAVLHGYVLIIPSIFALGVILAVVFQRRLSLVAAITAHGVFNAVGFSLYLTTLHVFH